MDWAANVPIIVFHDADLDAAVQGGQEQYAPYRVDVPTSRLSSE